ncbi:MAG: hypothetical protein K0R54_424 [Clostridiaceae bacterium]|jgi:hypothetical protein|nr:hypothetical protein [Clostridiaceae bacterium]
MLHLREDLNQAALVSLPPAFLKALNQEVLVLLGVLNQIILPLQNHLSLESNQTLAAVAIILKEVLFLYHSRFSPLTEVFSVVGFSALV